MGKIIGIDLGTTNSCVAVAEKGEPVIICNTLGSRITPSVVRFLENGEIVVGDLANRSRILDPKNTITDIKRFIGRRYNEIMDIAPTVPFDVVLGKNNLAMININGAEHTPQEISALIIQYLKSSAEKHLGKMVTEAVITIPAYFNDMQREATREAGRIAGLDIKRILEEPTAASLAYGFDKKKDALNAVFDLGGGTFDITIMECGEHLVEVKSIAGDGFLGGNDFDIRVIDWILEECKRIHEIDLSNDIVAFQRIKDASIIAKCKLSQLHEVVIDLPFIAFDREGKSINLNLILTRVKFEELCEELFEKLVIPCENALRDAGVKSSDISKVILVRGATRMPKVSEIVKRVFGVEPSKTINPDEAVALGAAVQGAVLGGEAKDILLLDVNSHSLGIESGEGMMHTMIYRNTTIPTKKADIFSTLFDNQSSVEINILEGERLLAVSNRSLGRFTLDRIPPAPRGIPQIEVGFDIDANRILNVYAKDLTTGKQNSITIKSDSGLSEEDIRKLISNAELLSAIDKEKWVNIELLNQLETLVYQTEKLLNEIYKKIPTNEISGIEEIIIRAKESLDLKNSSQIKSNFKDTALEMKGILEKIKKI